MILHKLRLVDPSMVRALFVEAKTVERRVGPSDGVTHPPASYLTNYNKIYKRKKKKLRAEVRRLKRSPQIWTEYQILNLEQMLVDFLKIDDLKERAKSELDELEEYAYDSAVSYDLRKFDRWDEKIRNCTEKIDEATGATNEPDPNSEKRDRVAEPLRAAVKNLQEHTASYSVSWTEGSWIVRSLIVCGCVTIPILWGLGTLPMVHPEFAETLRYLQFYNWGYLGASGALTAVVLALRKSDVTEVGVTAGKRELWQMVSGVALGFVAGILAYSMIWGKLVEGPLVPTVDQSILARFCRSVILAFAAGLAFEKFFDKFRSETNPETSLR